MVGPVSVRFVLAVGIVSGLVMAGVLSFWWCVVGIVSSVMGVVIVEGALVSSLDKATREKNYHLAWDWQLQSDAIWGLLVMGFCHGSVTPLLAVVVS